MAKSLREQLAGLGLVSEVAAKRAEKDATARQRQLEIEQKAAAQSRVLRDFKSVVKSRRALRMDYGDVVVEYKKQA